MKTCNSWNPRVLEIVHSQEIDFYLKREGQKVPSWGFKIAKWVDHLSVIQVARVRLLPRSFFSGNHNEFHQIILRIIEFL